MRTRVPCYPPALGVLLGPLSLCRVHTVRVCQSSPSVLCLCICHTPFFQLLLLMAGWARKKGIKSILSGNIFAFLQAGVFRAADGCGPLPEHSRDQPLPDTDWGTPGLSQAAGTTIGSCSWGWQVLDAELQMSHQLHERKPELIAHALSALYCFLG